MVQPNVNVPDVIRHRRSEGLSVGRTPVWDWRTGDFVMNDDGRIAESSDSTLNQITQAALTTKFATYPIYGFDFGSELYTLISKSREFVNTRSKGMIAEALNDPRIASVAVDGESIVVSDDILTFSVQVTDVFGGSFRQTIRIS